MRFAKDLYDGRIEQICILSDLERVKSEAEELRQLHAASTTESEDTLSAKTKKERFDGQSWDSLKASPFYDVLREHNDVLPDKIPAELPQDKGIQHEVDLVPGTKYCVTRQWPLPRDQVKAIDDFFEGRRLAGQVRESKSPHNEPTFCVKKPQGPSGSQPGAAQSAPTSYVSRGEVEEPSFDFEYKAPPVGRFSRQSAPPATVTQPQNAEVDRLRQRVLVLKIALGLGTGGDAAAQAGNREVLAKLEDRLHQLGREISELHDRVGRRAPSSDVDEAFRQLQQVRGALRDLAPRTETHSYGYAQPYSQPYVYGGYSAYPAGAQPYGAPPAYQTPRGPPMPRGSWSYAAGRSTTSEADSRFEELGPPSRGTPAASGERQAPAGHDTASDDPHKCRVRLHRLRQIDGVRSTMSGQDRERPNEAMLQLVAPYRSDSG
ncbi:hypothetical protein PC115_g23805 [Phytophthora cactorum]|uniref:Reverse transcriptase n=1 Tax=Phytophthora cactorum TaxID=29920 RepID=A0A8T1ACX0_9STRA|nr:hypothetical protein PC115_g23805 [Phytophthora cactorum]KAG3131435.1 hypothetical protein C6341_g23342 [Phytophthora cactorum]